MGARAVRQACGLGRVSGLAIDDAEAYEIRSAIDKLQQTLAGAGIAPR